VDSVEPLAHEKPLIRVVFGLDKDKPARERRMPSQSAGRV
jgi:hypothetical protein